jgi:probable HAF family extracellular repeat protein
MHYQRVLAFAALLVSIGRAEAVPPSITEIGTFSGFDRSSARAVSGDGSVVVGFASTPSSGFAAFRWTRSGGLVQLSGETATSVSGDGTTAVGNRSSSGFSAFRWVGTAATNLGRLPGTNDAFAWGISGDGGSVVGHCNIPGVSNHAYRWRSGTGMLDLGFLPGGTTAIAKATNGNGTVIVGNANAPNGAEFRDHAFRWTDAGGMQDLGLLPDTNESYALAVSGGGAVIAGYCVNTVTNRGYPFRWTQDTGMQDLGTVAGSNFRFMESISADGTVIGGSQGSSESNERALMWTAATGLVDLNTYLPGIGLDLSGWVLNDVGSVNADGTVLVGKGFHNGQPRGYVVVIPAPGAGMCLVLAGLAIPRRRRRKLQKQ